MPEHILLAEPRGFCAGVDRAIEIVEQALEQFGKPIYVRHEIVHNRHVVQRLKDMGAVFVDELNEVPSNAWVVFSAHGVSKKVQTHAKDLGLKVLDATCPLVTKVQLELIRHIDAGKQVILIGHAGHPEVEGTMGQVTSSDVFLVGHIDDIEGLDIRDEQQLAFVTQTTLSVDDTAEIIAALQQRFPAIVAPKREDICYATSNRQEAVKALAQKSDLVLILGSVNSSNSNRLREVAERQGCTAYLIDDTNDIQDEWLHSCKTIGLSAGASAPEVLVNEVQSYLQARGCHSLETLQVREEEVHFPLPQVLRR